MNSAGWPAGHRAVWLAGESSVRRPLARPSRRTELSPSSRRAAGAAAASRPARCKRTGVQVSAAAAAAGRDGRRERVKNERILFCLTYPNLSCPRRSPPKRGRRSSRASGPSRRS